MDGVGFDVELPVGVYRLKLVELVAVSDEEDEKEVQEEAEFEGMSIEELIDIAYRSAQAAEYDEEDDPPIYLIELECTEHAVPPTEGPTDVVWGPTWK